MEISCEKISLSGLKNEKTMVNKFIWYLSGIEPNKFVRNLSFTTIRYNEKFIRDIANSFKFIYSLFQ